MFNQQTNHVSITRRKIRIPRTMQTPPPPPPPPFLINQPINRQSRQLINPLTNHINPPTIWQLSDEGPGRLGRCRPTSLINTPTNRQSRQLINPLTNHINPFDKSTNQMTIARWRTRTPRTMQAPLPYLYDQYTNQSTTQATAQPTDQSHQSIWWTNQSYVNCQMEDPDASDDAGVLSEDESRAFMEYAEVALPKDKSRRFMIMLAPAQVCVFAFLFFCILFLVFLVFSRFFFPFPSLLPSLFLVCIYSRAVFFFVIFHQESKRSLRHTGVLKL